MRVLLSSVRKWSSDGRIDGWPMSLAARQVVGRSALSIRPGFSDCRDSPPGGQPLFLRPNIGGRPPASDPLRVRRRRDIRTTPSTLKRPGSGPLVAGSPFGTRSEPVMATAGDFRIFRCRCIDIRPAPCCTCGCHRATYRFAAPGLGRKGSRWCPPQDPRLRDPDFR